MFVVMKDKATSTLTLVAAKCVHAVLLAATIVLGALVLVCKDAKKSMGLCGLRSGHPRASGRPGRGFLLREGVHRRGSCGMGGQGDDGALATASVEAAEWASVLGREGRSRQKWAEVGGGRAGVWN